MEFVDVTLDTLNENLALDEGLLLEAEAGHVVLSGSFIKAIRFGAGDVVAADFTNLGTVTFSVSR